MVKKKQYNRRKNFQAFPFNVQLALLALADETVLKANLFVSDLIRGLFNISVDATWAVRGLTAGEGPINVGWAHNDLSIVEIKENLDVEMFDPSDIIARERSRRPVRKSGVFQGLTAVEVISNGNIIRTPLRFTTDIGHQIVFWGMNKSGANLTTGAVIEIQGTLYGRWI